MQIRTVVAVVAAFFAIAATAQAAPRVGFATDALEGGVIDAQRVQVTYDPDLGRLDASVRLNPKLNPVAFGGAFVLSVGSSERNGKCVADGVFDLRMDSTLNWDITYGVLYKGGHLLPLVGAAVAESFPDYTYAFQSRDIRHAGYRCVTDIRLGADSVPSFFFEGFGPPTIEWVTPRDGATVSGRLSESRNCLLRAEGPIVSTANYVDTHLNDVQVQAPWGCEIDTTRYANGWHTLTTRAYDGDGREVARTSIRVRIENEAPPPPEPPVKPVIEPRVEPGKPPVAPEPVVAPPPPAVIQVPGRPTVISSPPSSPRQKSVSRAQARRQAARALGRVYKRAFTNSRRYRATCRRNAATKQTCRVSWLYRRYQYRGRVVVKLVDTGYATTVDVRRLRR